MSEKLSPADFVVTNLFVSDVRVSPNRPIAEDPTVGKSIETGLAPFDDPGWSVGMLEGLRGDNLGRANWLGSRQPDLAEKLRTEAASIESELAKRKGRTF